MKIQESKEKLPITFITSFIKTGWEMIGNLTADVDAIKANYAKTGDIAEIIQDVVDAYTVAVSRIPLYLFRIYYCYTFIIASAIIK